MSTEDALLSQVLSGKKIVSSPTLNRLGLQIARTITAHGIYSLRRFARPQHSKAEVDTLRRDGLLIIEDFLPAAEFESIRQEFSDVYEHHEEKCLTLESLNRYQIAYFGKLPPDSISSSRGFIANPRVQTLFEGAERRPWKKVFQFAGFERVRFGASSGEPDPQITLHADSFFHTHKAWLYMEDVTEDLGPLALVKGSHHLTLRQIPYIYSHSCAKGVDYSRRITAGEIARSGLRETVLTCPGNTLVVANTAAYHRRTQGKPGAERRAVQIMSRASPFRP